MPTDQKQYYDSIAPAYDELYGSEQQAKVKLVRELMDNDPELELDPVAGKPWLLLDIGCGSGIATSVLPSIPCAGLDPALELLRRANTKRTLQKQNQDPTHHYGYVRGRAEALPFKSACSNITISLTAIHNFDDLELAVQELRRVTIDRAVISIMKRAKAFEDIIEKIKTRFKIITTAENDKDHILYLKPK